MGYGGPKQDILGIQVAHQDSGIVVPIHLPHQESQAERDGSCLFWQLRSNRKFDYALSSLELMEVDDETEMVWI